MKSLRSLLVPLGALFLGLSSVARADSYSFMVYLGKETWINSGFVEKLSLSIVGDSTMDTLNSGVCRGCKKGYNNRADASTGHPTGVNGYNTSVTVDAYQASATVKFTLGMSFRPIGGGTVPIVCKTNEVTVTIPAKSSSQTGFLFPAVPPGNYPYVAPLATLPPGVPPGTRMQLVGMLEVLPDGENLIIHAPALRQ